MVAVPSPLSVKVTLSGSAPVLESATLVGKPVVVTVNVPAWPVTKVVVFALVIVGGCVRCSVEFWVAVGVTPLLAVMTMFTSPEPVAVPASVAVPSLLLTKVTVPGSGSPVSLMAIDAPVGKPVAVTVNAVGVPGGKMAWLALVMAGACCTVRVKFCVAFGAMPLFAVMTIGYVPPVPAFGVPASVAVPSLLLTKVTPPGSAPLSLISIEAPLGKPVVVTENVPAWPTLNVAAFALVMAGGWLMTSVYVAPLAEQPLASTAWTTIGNEPLCVVVPDSVPFAASVKLVGSVLAVVNVTVPIVLVAVKFWLKATLV